MKAFLAAVIAERRGRVCPLMRLLRLYVLIISPLTLISFESNSIPPFRLPSAAAQSNPEPVHVERETAPRDQSRILAERAFDEAERLSGEWITESSHRAIEKYEEARAYWRIIGDRRSEADALRGSGRAYESLDDYHEALNHYEQALRLSRGANDTRGESLALDEIGYLNFRIGNNQKALDNATRALRLTRQIGNRLEEAQAIYIIGEAYYGFGDLQRALEHYRQAMQICRELDDRRGQVKLLVSMGYTYVELSDIPATFEAYDRALAMSREEGDRHWEAVTLRALGNLYTKIGDNQKAVEHFLRALDILQSVDDRHLKATALAGLGYAYEKAADGQRALEYYKQALSIFRAINHVWGESEATMDAGRVFHSLGDDQQALDYYDRALTLFRALNMPRYQAQTLRDMGVVYDSRGDKAKALRCYKQSLSLTRAGQDQRYAAYTLNYIGRVYESLGDRRRALSYYQQALPLSRIASDPSGESFTLYDIARVERDSGDLAAARTRVEEAIGISESLRTKVGGEDLRATFFASAQQYYELDIDVLMRLHASHPGEGLDAAALEVSERARARSLLETLNAARVGVRRSADPALLEREQRLRQELDEKLRLRTALVSEQGDGAAITREIDELTAQYQEAGARVRAASLEHTDQLQPQPLSLSEIRERDLDDDTLLLEFSLGEERSYLWVVSRDSLQSYELPPRGEIEAAAGRVRSLLVAPALVEGEAFDSRRERLKGSEDAYWREAGALSEMLLARAAAGLGTKRLLIVADGALQYIPFNALPVPGRDGELTPLLVEHEITHQPSASALATLRGVGEKRRPAAKAVAVFADPVFDAGDSRLVSGRDSSYEVAQAQTREAELSRALRDVGPTWDGNNIPRLLASRAEADAIMGVMSDGDNLNAIGFDADKAAATGPELSQYRIIHFATHGVLDSEHPELSGLLLSRFDSSGRPKEGFLRLDDIYNLNLPADLVVLSACNTGLGKDVKGEGLVGLVRGFMYAGSTRVVASLWKVDDDATAELMTRFYREMLEEKRSPASALREAQVAMWRQRHWRAPYYWAAFVLQGEYAGKIEAAQRPRRVVPLLLGAAALVISLSCLYAWRRRARGKIPLNG